MVQLGIISHLPEGHRAAPMGLVATCELSGGSSALQPALPSLVTYGGGRERTRNVNLYSTSNKMEQVSFEFNEICTKKDSHGDND